MILLYQVGQVGQVGQFPCGSVSYERDGGIALSYDRVGRAAVFYERAGSTALSYERTGSVAFSRARGAADSKKFLSPPDMRTLLSHPKQ